jgi:hypothetical protein
MNRKRLIFLLVIFNFVALGSLLSWLHYNQLHAPIQHHSHYQFASDSEELQFLNNWYKATNDTYFDSKLPKDTQIQIHDIPPDVHADFTIGQTTPLGNGQYIIEIDPRFNPSGGEEALTLDHEICHVFLLQQNKDGDNKHGVRFQNCMKRLADEGAFSDLW